jgi:hypothetical protein
MELVGRLLMLGAVAWAAMAAQGVVAQPQGEGGALGFCGRPYDTAVDAPYAIQGTWMYSRPACEWQNALEAFHRIGGTTVLQFGPSLRRFSPADPGQIATCTVGSRSCIEDAIDEIGASRISNWLSYEFGEHYGDAIACPSGLDKKIQVVTGNGVRTFWRIVLPHYGQSPCSYSSGTFDVLFVYYDEAETESVGSMLTVADALGMDAFLAAPAFPVLEGGHWDVDRDLIHSHHDWARRVYADWNSRHAGHPSFKGMYQSYELPVGSGYGSIYGLYQVDAQSFHLAHPAKKYAISPYLLLRRASTTPHTVAEAVTRFRQFAERGVDIVAPQDGRGTSLGAHYWPYQAGELVSTVDPVLGDFSLVDGSSTFSQQYVASARDVFRALANERTLLSQEGTNVELWANVEAFEQDNENPSFVACTGDLSQTSKSRMDRAITFVGGTADRVISFMYDPLFLCDNRFGTSLLQAIRNDYERPVVMDAFFWDSPGNGVAVRGHRLAWGTEFMVTWYDANWNVHSQQIAPGWVAPSNTLGELDVVWLPFDRSSLASDFFIHISASLPVAGGTKTAYEMFSFKY